MRVNAITMMRTLPRIVPYALASIWLAAPGPSTAEDVYALVIGIDDYAHINPLKGAVNDAMDVSDALAGIAARDVRTLIDHEATREAIFKNWTELTAAAGDGDVLIFHFAGHGGRQNAILEGHEPKDNLFLLSGFENIGPGRNERIVDNEIGHMLSVETEATVLFVADSCFAGGMVRSADVRAAIDVRTPGPSAEISSTDDAVAARVRMLGEVEDDALQHVVWLYAQDRNKVIQEVAVDGRRRGALSYAFARALRGEGDRNEDGQLDVPELKRFVNRTVTRISERRQRPEVNAGSSGISITIAERGSPSPAGVDVPTLRIHYVNGPAHFQLTGVEEVVDEHAADIVYDVVEGSVVYKTGDVVGEMDVANSPAELVSRLQGAIDKWRLLELLAALDSTNDPELLLSDGDRLYHAGETVAFSITSAHHQHVVLFNLAYDGTIQLVAPTRPGQPGLVGGELRIGRVERESVRVIPPFGADHLVAITTKTELPDLGDAVFGRDGKRLAVDLALELGEMLHGQEFGINWVGLYTRN